MCVLVQFSVESTNNVLWNKCRLARSKCRMVHSAFRSSFSFCEVYFSTKKQTKELNIFIPREFLVFPLHALSNLYKSSLSILYILVFTLYSNLDNYVFRFHDKMLSRTFYWKLLISQFLLFTGWKLWKLLEHVFLHGKEIETFKFDANYINFEKENMIIVYYKTGSEQIFQQ